LILPIHRQQERKSVDAYSDVNVLSARGFSRAEPRPLSTALGGRVSRAACDDDAADQLSVLARHASVPKNFSARRYTSQSGNNGASLRYA
jgi:hypothetical protein